MPIPKNIRRDQLAKFIPDNETILRFQRFFYAINTDIPADVTSLEDRVTALETAVEENEFYIMTRGLC